MIIKLIIEDADSVADIKATGAKDVLQIINKALGLKVVQVKMQEITDKNKQLRDAGEEYEYYNSEYKI
jgi:hypothetical protein